MGDKHGHQWMRALPWVMLGKRVQVQPDLDTSAATLVFGKSLSLPGQLLGHPGPPLTNLQTKALLHELYKMSERPALQTTSVSNPIDISMADKAEFVYVKNHEPQHGLCPRFEGPFRVVDRPSRSQVTVKVGTFADGSERRQTFHWTSCKIAHMRSDAVEASRPQLGRKPKSDSLSKVPDPSSPSDGQNTTDVTQQTNCHVRRPSVANSRNPESQQNIGAKIQNELTPTARRNPSRSARNPSPYYVDAVSFSCVPRMSRNG